MTTFGNAISTSVPTRWNRRTRRFGSCRGKSRKNQLALQVQQKINSIPSGYDLDHLLKYEGSIEKQFYKAINQLERLQRMRAGDQVPPPVNIDVAVDAENPG